VSLELRVICNGILDNLDSCEENILISFRDVIMEDGCLYVSDSFDFKSSGWVKRGCSEYCPNCKSDKHSYLNVEN